MAVERQHEPCQQAILTHNCAMPCLFDMPATTATATACASLGLKAFYEGSPFMRGSGFRMQAEYLKEVEARFKEVSQSQEVQ